MRNKGTYICVLMGQSFWRIVCQVSEILKMYIIFDTASCFLEFNLRRDNQGCTQRFIHKGFYHSVANYIKNRSNINVNKN